MMRVLQIVQRPQLRGAEIFAQQLNRQLARFGHDTRTIYLYPYTGDLPLVTESGDVLLQGNEHNLSERVPGIDPGLLKRTTSAIREFEPDIVQVNGARTVKYGAFAKRLSARNGWSLVYRNIDDPAYWVRDRRRLWFYRYLVMPQVDGTVGVSNATLQSVVEQYRLTSPVVFIPNGIDTERLDVAPDKRDARTHLEIAPDAPCLLFVGNLTEQKRPDRFVHLVSRLHQTEHGVEGWLAGDGPLRHQLQHQAESLGTAAATHFVGYTDDVGVYMRAADILVVTSDSDGIPAAILEAAYLGTPVVAMDVGGISDCVLDGETGILVPSQDEPALAEAVTGLLRDPDTRASMGQRAHEWIAERFTMDQVASRYVDFYNTLLQPHAD